jgi:hypothetical protein
MSATASSTTQTTHCYHCGNKRRKSLEDKTKSLATKDDIINLQRRMTGIFVTLALMIIRLYFKKP